LYNGVNMLEPEEFIKINFRDQEVAVIFQKLLSGGSFTLKAERSILNGGGCCARSAVAQLP